MRLFSILVFYILAISLAVASPINLQARAGGKCYRGRDFPAPNEWVSFSEILGKYRGTMLGFNSADEVKFIEQFVHEAAGSSGLDPRIILAVIIQESHGNLRVAAGGGRTPGIMQALGSPHCQGTAKGGCGKNTIKDMIFAGVLGTGQTTGLKKCHESNGRSYGAMLRCYNSGHVFNPNDLIQAGPGTPSYVSDIANRLRGADPPLC
ncbi:hypothetical protein AJ79_00506 [Helicocarpus griseus UAMH5409]|uniref:Transglycosylase SLT domain-containing protein n=1 Tax=Helicocarpus griseus UAMH5409 TaxID=1447875 RepID=A0A2B7YCW4_9EURO|nr:hypothetical protein AJ79_00506 [Helicocarpus griseus UAMH5409]